MNTRRDGKCEKIISMLVDGSMNQGIMFMFVVELVSVENVLPKSYSCCTEDTVRLRFNATHFRLFDC